VFQPYEKSARYYDMFYCRVIDYRAECDLLERIFKKHSDCPVRTILDIGCGTGNHDLILAKRGYKVTGIDLSDRMISVAQRKARGRNNPIFYRMDMHNLTINRKFDAAFVLLGAFEYLLENREAEMFLKSTKRLLDGILVFDFSQKYGPKWWFRIGDKTAKNVLVRLDEWTTLKRNRLKGDFHWYFMNSGETRILDRFSESHLVRTHSMPEIKWLLSRNGFQLLSFYDMRLKPPSSSSFRVICVARPSP